MTTFKLFALCTVIALTGMTQTAHAEYGDERDQIINQLFKKAGPIQKHFATKGFRTRADVSHSLFSEVTEGIAFTKVPYGQNLAFAKTEINAGQAVRVRGPIWTAIEADPRTRQLKKANFQLNHLTVDYATSAQDYIDQYDLVLSAAFYGMYDRKKFDVAGDPQVTLSIIASRSEKNLSVQALQAMGFKRAASSTYGNCVVSSGNFLIAILSTVGCIPEASRRSAWFQTELN